MLPFFRDTLYLQKDDIPPIIKVIPLSLTGVDTCVFCIMAFSIDNIGRSHSPTFLVLTLSRTVMLSGYLSISQSAMSLWL